MNVISIYERFSKQKDQTYLIAIDGCGGAGKSTLAAALQNVCGPNAIIVHADDFYQLSAKRADGIGGNWDLNRLENQLLKPLSQNQSAHYERYDWETDKLAELHFVSAGSYVIIEGCYTMVEHLLPYYHFKIWVESPEEIRLKRGIERDGEGMRHMWENVWMPAEKVYIKAQNPAGSADLIVSGISAR